MRLIELRRLTGGPWSRPHSYELACKKCGLRVSGGSVVMLGARDGSEHERWVYRDLVVALRRKGCACWLEDDGVARRFDVGYRTLDQHLDVRVEWEVLQVRDRREAKTWAEGHGSAVVRAVVVDAFGVAWVTWVCDPSSGVDKEFEAMPAHQVSSMGNIGVEDGVYRVLRGMGVR